MGLDDPSDVPHGGLVADHPSRALLELLPQEHVSLGLTLLKAKGDDPVPEVVGDQEQQLSLGSDLVAGQL